MIQSLRADWARRKEQGEVKQAAWGLLWLGGAGLGIAMIILPVHKLSPLWIGLGTATLSISQVAMWIAFRQPSKIPWKGAVRHSLVIFLTLFALVEASVVLYGKSFIGFYAYILLNAIRSIVGDVKKAREKHR
ncbi:MAG: hypothetical protein JSS72_09335 [Armatimonadetes bacterium]|nr:hypothetical protein [Armatimonadota bacterium]